MEEYVQAHKRREQTRISKRNTRWEPPEQTFVKVNFDGATDAGNSLGGSRVIISDHKGYVLRACAVKVTGISDPMIVEAVSAVIALKFAEEMSFQRSSW
ncbi:hypothetical protein REPUB_Repub02eG0222200 [Reevesia pubescens]